MPEQVAFRIDFPAWLKAQTSQSEIRIALAARTRVFCGGQPLSPPPRHHRETGYVATDLQVEARPQDVFAEELRLFGFTDGLPEDAATLEELADDFDGDLLIAQVALRHADHLSGVIDAHRVGRNVRTEKLRIDGLIVIRIGDPAG